MLAARIKNFITEVKVVVERIASCYSETGVPALCYSSNVLSSPDSSQQGWSLADLNPSILFAVPRNRRTAQIRRTRRSTLPDMQHARPKTNIVICLNCGHPHERETICGNCYSKVRAETEKMRASMDQDTYFYDQPRTEVGYLYKNENVEEIPKYKGRYLVEIDTERPSWFPNDFDKKGK